MKHITIVTPTYNEEANVAQVYDDVKAEFEKLKANYSYSQIFIDNSSQDKTQEILRDLAKKDSNIKLIFNAKNYGHIISPYYGLLQSEGDAAILFVSDGQDPASIIPRLIQKWEEGHTLVAARKTKSKESKLMYLLRSFFYFFLKSVATQNLIENFTGLGLYDKSVIETLKKYPDPYPYLRGLILEISPKTVVIDYTQEKRKKGKTKNNFYTLYDIAILGITFYSKLPIRLAGLTTLISSIVLIILAITNPITVFEAFVSILLIMNLTFLSIIGEYLLNIQTRVQKKPLVIERERINFQ